MDPQTAARSFIHGVRLELVLPPPTTRASGSPTLEIKLVILKSIDWSLGARGAFVQFQPSPLDVAAHHVNFSVR